MTLCHPKMQPHTKLGIPSSNNIEKNAHRTFGISLHVISDLIKAITVVRQVFLRQLLHSIHQILNEQAVTVLAFIGVLEKRKYKYL